MSRWKSCPRCKGYVWLDRDKYGWYEQCIMCGYQRDFKSIISARKHYPNDILTRERQVALSSLPFAFIGVSYREYSGAVSGKRDKRQTKRPLS